MHREPFGPGRLTGELRHDIVDAPARPLLLDTLKDRERHLPCYCRHAQALEPPAQENCAGLRFFDQHGAFFEARG
jgi:hypothetical protein